ncbi:MAG: transposase, partial [Verrucomicrobiales bacterium]|nr:transposase [Verrucomicrobiales bacterium]
MRQPRLCAPRDWSVAYYHCFSRIVDRRRVLGPDERRLFVALMREYEVFCGVQILTFCVMSNHFHLLVGVPSAPSAQPSTEELLARFEVLTGRSPCESNRQQIEAFRRGGDTASEQRWRDRVCRRLWNISEFMKLVKQRFSQIYNRRQARQGTLWESRFGSVLIEGAGRALTAIAAYIDLNPVRGGLVRDPKDYPWSGYGEAEAGQAKARAGLGCVTQALYHGEEMTEERSLERYRMHVFR